MDVLIIILQFVLSISILVILHELGHFIPARLFKTRVEKFYLFFDPWFSLFKKKIGGTEYGIGWLPLGGYVKISGMIDESMDKEQMKGPVQPWEFRAKPTWQRLIIMLGGVIVNFILGFVIFAMILMVWGEEYLPSDQVQDGIYVDSIGGEIGLMDGDQILSIDNGPFERFDSRQLLRAIVINEASSLRVLRAGAEVDIPIDAKWVTELSSHKNRGVLLFGPRWPIVVQEVLVGYPANEAGIEAGDQIISLNGNSTPYFNELMDFFKPDSAVSYKFGVFRDGDTLSFPMVTNEEGKIGVKWYGPDHFFELQRQTYSMAQALPAGVSRGYRFITDQIKAFGKMFSGKIKASESLGGFGTISSLFPTTWQWESFWRVTAVLSLILGFMNLLPIPALDGGHVLFLLYEMITGRKPSDKFLEYATMAGFVLILALLLYANGLDIMRWWNK